MKNIKKLLEIVKIRHNSKNIKSGYFDSWNSQKYFEELILEISEAKIENKKNNSVYLEDELWDILWDYLNLLEVLEMEKKINLENVFSRAYKKYSTRVNWKIEWKLWSDIKIKQKEENKKEFEEMLKNVKK